MCRLPAVRRPNHESKWRSPWARTTGYWRLCAAGLLLYRWDAYLPKYGFPRWVGVVWPVDGPYGRSILVSVYLAPSPSVLANLDRVSIAESVFLYHASWEKSVDAAQLRNEAA